MLWLLQERGGTSNRQVRSVLGLSEDRFKAVKETLIQEGLVEKFRCRGGGLLLTAKAAKQKAAPDVKSSVSQEKDLYAPFVSALRSESEENEERALIIDSSALRNSGKWSNPDVVKVAVRSY